MFTDSGVILGVGGGIAAYKSCELVRRLRDLSYHVTVVPTPASLNFVGKATWEALSGRPVRSEVWEGVEQGSHVALAATGAPILIAPATADLIARITHGRADDLLTNTVLATTAPIFIAPAMHSHMWSNSATQENIELLRQRGYGVLEPEMGALTSGDHGVGRLPDVRTIIEGFETFLGKKKDLAGRRVLITAGGTREAIDPVRFIGNLSTGKQGYALACAAASRGAEVDLVMANASFPSRPGITFHPVSNVEQMSQQLDLLAPTADIIIAAAAVSDIRPVSISTEKIHKGELRSIELTQNPDLLKSMVAHRRAGQFIVGFAAETNDHIRAGREKLDSKGVDALYVNDVSGGSIFGSDKTYGTILLRDGAQISVGESSKEAMAHKLLDAVRERLV